MVRYLIDNGARHDKVLKHGGLSRGELDSAFVDRQQVVLFERVRALAGSPRKARKKITRMKKMRQTLGMSTVEKES